MRASLRAGVAAGAIMAGALLAGPLAAGSAAAAVVDHNGTLGSTPAGSGLVNVALACTSDVTGNGPVDTCTKDFRELATHVMLAQYGPGGGFATLQETIFNHTGVAWTDYHITVQPGASLSDTGVNSLPPGVGADVNLGAGTLDIFFTGGVIADGDSFGVGLFLVGNEGGFTVTVTQAPSVASEPASLTLMGAGLAGLAALRRRRMRRL